MNHIQEMLKTGKRVFTLRIQGFPAGISETIKKDQIGRQADGIYFKNHNSVH